MHRRLAVTVVIVSWNNVADLRRCLESLLKADLDGEVIVVDNASTDESASMVEGEFPTVHLLKNVTNVGFAAACNQGLTLAQGRFVLLLNSDIRALDGSVSALVRFLDATPGCAGACGRLLNADGTTQIGFNVRRLPRPVDIMADILLPPKAFGGMHLSSRYRALDFDYDVTGPAEQPAAACLMIRTSLLRSMGGMDERFYPAWWEDVDLCKRLHDQGLHLQYIPDARFIHRGSGHLFAYDAPAADRQRAATLMPTFYLNLIRYIDKHHGAGLAMAMRMTVVFGMLLRLPFVAAASARRPGAHHKHVNGRAALSAVRPYCRVIAAMATSRNVARHAVGSQIG